MPIDREQFNEGIDDLQYRMLKFLQDNPKDAYECIEILEQLGAWNPPQEGTGMKIVYAVGVTFGVCSSLDELVRKGSVDKKNIDGKSYYSVHI